MPDPFFDPSDEPAAVCGNCDSHHLGHCINKQSVFFKFFSRGPTDGCDNFFPDPQRWPDADHD